MTKAQLRQAVIDTGSHFFDRSTMRFFGDTMANFAAASKPTEIIDNQGNTRQVYWLQHKRQTPRMSGGIGLGWSLPYYFDAQTFARVFPKREA